MGDPWSDNITPIRSKSNKKVKSAKVSRHLAAELLYAPGKKIAGNSFLKVFTAMKLEKKDFPVYIGDGIAN